MTPKRVREKGSPNQSPSQPLTWTLEFDGFRPVVGVSCGPNSRGVTGHSHELVPSSAGRTSTSGESPVPLMHPVARTHCRCLRYATLVLWNDTQEQRVIVCDRVWVRVGQH